MPHSTRRWSIWWPLTILLAAGLVAGFGSADPSLARTAVPATGAVTAAVAGPQCAGLQNLGSGGRLAERIAQTATSAQWIRLEVTEGLRYKLAVEAPVGLALALHDACDPEGAAVALPGGELEFTATADDELYLHIGHAGISGAGSVDYAVSLSPAAPHRPTLAALNEVPPEVLRRASDFLLELAASGQVPEWQGARINPTVHIVYRPDLQTPAYYEASVEQPIDGAYRPAGFIQLAAGEHDYPITRWDVAGRSPAGELSEIAPLGATITQIYRLDPIAYVAEYEELTPLGITTAAANNILNIGDLPLKIAGLDALAEEPAELVTESVDSTGEVTYDGPSNLPALESSAWDSWAALKAGYAEAYRPMLRSLAQRASPEWELANSLSAHGESLLTGDVRVVYGLPGQTVAQISVTGPGAAPQYLSQEQLTAPAAPTGVRLTVLAEPADRSTLLPFEVGLTYTSGLSETVKFAIINRALARTNSVYLPLVSLSRPAGAAAAAPAAELASTSSTWRYWWAEGDAGSITYNQIPPRTGINTSSCYSGCGATAWAMLFGWVDRRVGHPVWGPHWGIYRVDGGLGADAVAPLGLDNGVRAMTWELRGHLGTFCSGTGGATYVTDMIKAANYVRPRVMTPWRMSTRYDPTGLCWFGACNDARRLAKDAITIRREPAILAANSHYPLAYGYRENTRRSCFLFFCRTTTTSWFYVNNGWGGYGNDWVKSDDVFFAGVYDDS